MAPKPSTKRSAKRRSSTHAACAGKRRILKERIAASELRLDVMTERFAKLETAFLALCDELSLRLGPYSHIGKDTVASLVNEGNQPPEETEPSGSS